MEIFGRRKVWSQKEIGGGNGGYLAWKDHIWSTRYLEKEKEKRLKNERKKLQS